jgi:hypothetical protein
MGLVDPGQFMLEVDQDNSDAGQIALMTAQVTGLLKNFKLLLPNGNTATFTAYVKKFNSQGGVDQAIRRSRLLMKSLASSPKTTRPARPALCWSYAPL